MSWRYLTRADQSATLPSLFITHLMNEPAISILLLYTYTIQWSNRHSVLHGSHYPSSLFWGMNLRIHEAALSPGRVAHHSPQWMEDRGNGCFSSYALLCRKRSMPVMMPIASRRSPSPLFRNSTVPLRKRLFVFWKPTKSSILSADWWIANRSSNQSEIGLIESYQPIFLRKKSAHTTPPADTTRKSMGQVGNCCGIR